MGYGVNGDVTTTAEHMPEALERLGMPTRVGDQGLKGFDYHQLEPYVKNGEEEGVSIWGKFCKEDKRLT